MSGNEHNEEEFSLKKYFLPLTTIKAIHFIAIIGFIVFFNTLFNGFVGDDNGQIVSNSFVHSLLSIPTFFTVSTFNLGNGISGFYYKPLLLTLFSLIYSVSGQNAFLFHFIQVILGITNAILVFLLLKKLINKSLAFFFSLIFLVHPINQDSIAYISNTQDVLFFFFGMIALLFAFSKKTKYWELIVYSMLVLSLLSKETGIAFVLIYIIYVLLFNKKQIKPTVLFSSILLIVYSLVHVSAVGLSFVTQHEYHIGRLSLLERLISVPRIVSYYLQTFVLPFPLSINYDWVVSKFNLQDFYFPIVVDIIFLFIVFVVWKKLQQEKSNFLKSFIFFAAWFFIGLSFHLQIIPLDGTVSTRWFYLPIVGLLGMIAIVFETALFKRKTKYISSIILLTIVAVFSILTIMRNTDFKDNLTLMCHDAKISESNFSLENSCGVSLLEINSLDAAQYHLEKSVALASYYGTNYWALGAVLGKRAEQQKSRALYYKSETAFKTAIKIEPAIPWSYQSLGYLYAHYSDSKTAKSFLESALRKFPNDSDLWFSYAYEEYRSGDTELSLQAITNAYKLNPNDTSVSSFYYNLSKNLPINISQTRLY